MHTKKIAEGARSLLVHADQDKEMAEKEYEQW